jgi:hypothetical protein
MVNMNKWILTHEGLRVNTDHVMYFFIEYDPILKACSIISVMKDEKIIIITSFESIDQVNEWFGTHLGV